jgi:hypothetical protein
LARYRLSDPAKADIAALLRTSETMHGANQQGLGSLPLRAA